jgi:hypothetical protein
MAALIHCSGRAICAVENCFQIRFFNFGSFATDLFFLRDIEIVTRVKNLFPLANPAAAELRF